MILFGSDTARETVFGIKDHTLVLAKWIALLSEWSFFLFWDRWHFVSGVMHFCVC